MQILPIIKICFSETFNNGIKTKLPFCNQINCGRYIQLPKTCRTIDSLVVPMEFPQTLVAFMPCLVNIFSLKSATNVNLNGIYFRYNTFKLPLKRNCALHAQLLGNTQIRIGM